MPGNPYGSATEAIFRLRVGKTCFVSGSRGRADNASARVRRDHPERVFSTTVVEGGHIVTRRPDRENPA